MKNRFLSLVIAFIFVGCANVSARIFIYDVITERTDSIWNQQFRYSEDVDTAKYIDLAQYRDLPDDTLELVNFEGVQIKVLMPWTPFPAYLQGAFPAKLGKTKYVIGYNDSLLSPHIATEVHPISMDFRVGDLHIGDEVDTSTYEKKYTPGLIGEYSYKIPGTNWYFAVNEGKIYKFWGYTRKKLVDEVMTQNE